MTTATPDVDLLEDLVFTVEIPCQCAALHSEYGTGPAIWLVTVGCPVGCDHFRVTSCDGCLTAYRNWTTKILKCPVCARIRPAPDFILHYEPL